jgi:hypothetical protein
MRLEAIGPPVARHAGCTHAQLSSHGARTPLRGRLRRAGAKHKYL